MRGSSGQTWVHGWAHWAALWSGWPANPGFRADSIMSEPQEDRVTCSPSHNACSAGPDPAGNRGPRVQATLLCSWKGGRSCTWQDLGFLPQHVRHVGRRCGVGGPLGPMNQSLPSSNSLLFVLLQVENALSPPRCPGRHPHTLPRGPESCLQERPFLPTNPYKAADQTRPSPRDPAPLRSFGGYAVEGTLLWRPRTWEGQAPQGGPFLPRSFSEHLSAGCQAERLAPSVFLSLSAS